MKHRPPPKGPPPRIIETEVVAELPDNWEDLPPEERRRRLLEIAKAHSTSPKARN